MRAGDGKVEPQRRPTVKRWGKVNGWRRLLGPRKRLVLEIGDSLTVVLGQVAKEAEERCQPDMTKPPAC